MVCVLFTETLSQITVLLTGIAFVILMIVLLSLQHNAWQISDFGLTQPGASKKAIPTRNAKGTEGYRPPEILRPRKHVFCKQSDIFALGCIGYEISEGKSAFLTDWDVYEYIAKATDIPKFVDLQMDQPYKTCLVKMIHAMLRLDWWMRPSARDI